jgi:hypothetical protein
MDKHRLFEYFRFPDEESARVYLEGRRWPLLGPICPGCGSGERVATLGTCTTRKPGFYRCLPCGCDFTVRTNTVMERSHVPLHKWVRAMLLFQRYFRLRLGREATATAPDGTDPLMQRIALFQFSDEIGVTQKTGRFVLRRLREACDESDGPIEVLDKIADVVLTYRPKPKTNVARKRAKKKAAKKGNG